MSISTAHFAVRRGDTTYSCLGSKLSESMERGDLLLVSRNGTNCHYTVDEVYEDIQDTDELIITAEDGITYRVSGESFLELFYTLPISYTYPIVNGIPIESKTLSVEDKGSITRGTPPYKYDTTDWYLHDPSNPDLEDEKIETGGGLQKEPGSFMYTESFDSQGSEGGLLAYQKVINGNFVTGLVPISGTTLKDGEAVIYDSDLKIVDRYTIPANKAMVNTGNGRPKLNFRLVWSYSQMRIVNLASYTGGGRNSTWHWLDMNDEGKIVLNSALQENNPLTPGMAFFNIFGSTYCWDITNINYGAGNTRPQCSLSILRGIRTGYYKKHWVGSSTEYELEVNFSEGICTWKKRTLDGNYQPLPSSNTNGNAGYFDKNVLNSIQLPGIAGSSNKQYGVLNPGKGTGSYLIAIVNDYFLLFNASSREIITIDASKFFKEVSDPFCSARYDAAEKKIKTNMYEIGIDGTYTVYPSYTAISERSTYWNNSGRLEFDFLPHVISYPLGTSQAVVTSRGVTVQADDTQVILLPEYVDKEVYAVCTHSDSRDVNVSMPSNSMLIGADVSDKYLQVTKPVEILFDETTKQLTINPHELNTSATGRAILKNSVGISLTYHFEPVAALPEGVGLDTHTHEEIVAMAPLDMLPHLSNVGEPVAVKNAQWKLGFDPNSTDSLYTLLFSGNGALSVNGLRYENHGRAHMTMLRSTSLLSVSLIEANSDFNAWSFNNGTGLKPLRGSEKVDEPPLDLGAGELTQPFAAGTFANPKLASINVTMISRDDISAATSFAAYKVDERTVYEYLSVKGYP